MSIELRLLNCKDVMVPDDYPRQKAAQADLLELGSSFEELGGVLLPILVLEDQVTRELLLIKGARRLIARSNSGEETIPSLVISGGTKIDLVRYRAATHLSNLSLSAFETALLLEQIRDTYNLPHNGISKLVGWGNSNSGRIKVGHYLRMLTLPEEALELFKGVDSLPISMSVVLNRLSGNVEALVWAAQKAAKDKLSVRELDALVTKLERHEVEHPARLQVKGTTNDPGKPGADFEDDYYSLKSAIISAQYGAEMKLKARTDGSITININVGSEAKLRELLDTIAAEESSTKSRISRPRAQH